MRLHYCRRCGLPKEARSCKVRRGVCAHGDSTRTVFDGEHARRIRARYLLGRVHNPDHDTADYTDRAEAERAATLPSLNSGAA